MRVPVATAGAAAQGGVGRFDVWHIFHSPFDVGLMCVVGVLLIAVVWKRTRRFRAVRAPAREGAS